MSVVSIVPIFTEWKPRYSMAHHICTVRLQRSYRLVFVRLMARQTVCLYFSLYYWACKSYLCGAILCLDRQLSLWSHSAIYLVIIS